MLGLGDNLAIYEVDVAVIAECPDAGILGCELALLTLDGDPRVLGVSPAGRLIEAEVKAIVVIQTVDQSTQGVMDVIGAGAVFSDAPAQFHSLVHLVDAAVVGLLLARAVKIPVFINLILYAGLVGHCDFTHTHAVQVVLLDESLGTLVAHIALAHLDHTGMPQVVDDHTDVHIIDLMGPRCGSEQGHGHGRDHSNVMCNCSSHASAIAILRTT